ncbi:hypothetical protein D5086_029213 [Populus alba]|uniref:Uncharacterized protein n=3 Tax=Populus TaxID=3689 RepID=A0A4U5NSI3_POPAL|nr:hypothetical protein NC653_036354 [Populus alba x Populus x berolinensis]TKR86060.1 hypothetical protein D5086_0000241320 [Populus alba]
MELILQLSWLIKRRRKQQDEAQKISSERRNRQGLSHILALASCYGANKMRNNDISGICLRCCRFMKVNNNVMIFQLKHCSEICRITVPAEERASELLIQSPEIFTFQWNEIFLGLSRPVDLQKSIVFLFSGLRFWWAYLTY